MAVFAVFAVTECPGARSCARMAVFAVFAVTECPGARSCARASVILTCPPLCMLQRCTCIQRTLVFHTVNSEGVGIATFVPATVAPPFVVT